MSEQDNTEDRLRSASSDLRGVAQNLAAAHRPTAAMLNADRREKRRPSWVVGFAAAGVVALGIAGLVAIRSGSDVPSDEPVAEPIEALVPAVDSTAVDGATTAPSVPTSPSPTQAGTESAERPIVDASIDRPVFDSTVCETVAVANDGRTGLPLHPNLAAVIPFLRPSVAPIPVQVFGNPELGVAAPFLVVTHLRTDSDIGSEDLMPTSNGTVWSAVADNGATDYTWELADGSRGLIRTLDVDEDAVVEFIEHLDQRPTQDLPAGFDLIDAPEDLEPIVESTNDNLVSGGVGSTCVTPSGMAYRLWSPRGDEVYGYVSVLDRFAPIEVSAAGGHVWIVSGPASPEAPTVAQVQDASSEQWEQLLAQEPPLESLSVTIGTPSEFEMAPIDRTEPTSSVVVTFIASEDGNRVEIDTSNAQPPLGTAFWYTEIGQRGGITSINGGTMGVTLRGESSPFTFQIRAVDEDGQTVAATKPIDISVEGL